MPPRDVVSPYEHATEPEPQLPREGTTDVSPAPSGPGTREITPLVSNNLLVLGPLGQGGMGQVVLGEQLSLGREVALKMIPPRKASPELAAALLHEARIAGGLEHPNIIPIHDLGLDDAGNPVLVMKRVDGVTLRSLLRDPLAEGWTWLREATGAHDRTIVAIHALVEIAGAVAFAHERGVLHRDIKPDNILIGKLGEVYLADWGTALRLPQETKTKTPIGTPAYMAPEMATPGSLLSAASDIYLLGATLHEILTNQKRHTGSSVEEILAQARESKLVEYPPEIPKELASLCNDATASEPGLRPPSVGVFRDRLRAYLRHDASERLTREAQERLRELRSADPRTDAPLHKLLIECRFAFEMALREWPENPDALSGREQFLEEAFRVELARNHLLQAQALLGEMRSPTEAMRALLEGALAAQRQEKEEAKRHREVAEQNDPNRGQKERLQIILLAILGWTVSALPHLPKLSTEEHLTVPGMRNASLVQLSAVALLALFKRKTLVASSVNQRFLLLIASIYALTGASRWLGGLRGNSLETQLAGDGFLIGAVVLSGASELGWLGRLSALPPVLGSFAMLSAPRRPAVVFGLCVLCMLLMLGAANLRAREERS